MKMKKKMKIVNKDTALIKELQKLFGKEKVLVPFQGWKIALNCEETYNILHYDTHYWGIDELHDILDKYDYHLEWYNSCICVLFEFDA